MSFSESNRPEWTLRMIWFHRTLWFCLLVFVTYVSGMFGGHRDWSEYFRRSLTLPGYVAFMFLPFVYWESFCRFAIPDPGWGLHLLSSLCRLQFVFAPAHYVFTRFSFALGRKFRVPLYYAEAFGLGIAFGCFSVIAVDSAIAWTRRKKQLQTQDNI